MRQDSVSCQPIVRRWFIAGFLLLAGFSLSSASLAAEKGGAAPAAVPPAANPQGDSNAPKAASAFSTGRFLRVKLPLTGDDDERVKNAIERALKQFAVAPHNENSRPTLVLELVPKPRSAGNGEGTDFTRALSVARYLIDPKMSAVKTVAYIPRTLKSHGVLIALACDEIAMNPEAEIGDASIDEDASRAIDPSIVNAYRDIAASRRTVPSAIAISMVDRRLGLLKVETDQNTEFIANGELATLKKNHTIVSQDQLVPVGSLASFTGRQAREFGFAKLLASDYHSLARGLDLRSDVFKSDLALAGELRPVMVRVDGPITRRKVSQLSTLVGTEIARGADWIGVEIDSTGGDLKDCLDLAHIFAKLNPDQVETVAYVPVEASGGAALVALACDQLVMHPEAHLGGTSMMKFDRANIDAAIKELQGSKGRRLVQGWSLAAAMIDPAVELFSFQNTRSGEICLLSNEEHQRLADKDDWRQGVRVKPAGEVWRLTSNKAQELEIASRVVASFDEFKHVYDLTNDVRMAEPNLALEFVEALASPALTVLLIIIGFVGIYVELHAPGTGVGAFVAALAFLLFFWSHFLDGTAGWLEVLLFLGGLFCVALEALVIPGFGIFGLGGGVMILASLVLASQTFVLPRTESQMAELRHSLTIVAAAMVVVVASSIALRRFLPKAPVFNKMVLEPTSEVDLIDLNFRESLVDYSHLLGQVGTATTHLMPSGKADFNGQLIDVITEGLPIDRGTSIVVVKARGNRVLVRAADV